MNTLLPNPALAAVGPAPTEQPVFTPQAVSASAESISDKVNSVLFYGLLAFGMGFPVVASLYALIAY
ncbi:MAG: hypothetical protein R3337_06995 [Gammaproteobacteria bacterium]|nr:hypothetical protein [Gammaproteobacteria bacterium]